MSGTDTPQNTCGSIVVSCSPRAYGRHQVKGVNSFLSETLPNLHGYVFAGTSTFHLSLVWGRNG